MTRNFPSDEVLADYAGGTLPPGLSLLVASHLTYSPESRARVEALEGVAGALFEAEPAGSVPAPPLDDVLARLDAEPADVVPAASSPPCASDSVLPAPVRAVFGGDEHSIKWKFRLPGLSEAVVDGFEGEEVSLLRARPGAPIFSHTHDGLEATLVMSGQMEDRGQIYERGDVAFATDQDDHRPRIVGEETCICLIVMTGGLRFTGPFSRALNIFAE